MDAIPGESNQYLILVYAFDYFSDIHTELEGTANISSGYYSFDNVCVLSETS